jgi:hypothetical protein
MSFDDTYQKMERHEVPYFFRVSGGEKELYYFGANIQMISLMSNIPCCERSSLIL